MEGESSTLLGEILLAKLTRLGSSEKNFPQFSQQIPYLSQKSKKAQKLHKNEVPFKDLLLDKKNIQATAEISCRRWKVKSLLKILKTDLSIYLETLNDKKMPWKISARGKKMFAGRQKKFPANIYSSNVLSDHV